jgi:hypothetical protein
MIKKNKGFLLLNIIALLVLVILLIYLFLVSKDLESMSKDFKELTADLSEVKTELFLENSLEDDLNLALAENELLLDRFKFHKNFWDNYLNPAENIFISHQAQSASGVNAYLSRLLPSLRNRCITNGVKLNFPNAQIIGDELTKRKEFGFGFSAYNGFWPSFDKTEAALIEIQAKIINQIVDSLASSTTDGQHIELVHIKREAVGVTDKKYIGNDLIDSISDSLLLRTSSLVQSYRFQVSFVGRTENARSFINQLRLPLSVRKIEALRASEDNLSNNTKFVQFDNAKSTDATESDILPIIRDIKTRFIIDLEYIYEILYKETDFIKLSGFSNIDHESFEQIIDKFKSN